MVLDDKQRQIGRDNFNDGSRVTRRQLLTGALAVPAAAGVYWGYDKLEEGVPPVRVGLIGTGNQGCNAHISQSNPDYVDIVAFSDIRPSNQKRARRLFSEKYGEKAKDIKLYVNYEDMLKDDNIEMIIIATPLFLHKEMTIKALEHEKHVLCEKLMAKTVAECKEMVRAADKAERLLAIGHQRHYSYLYANALSLIQAKALGEIRHIRAYWHRNQSGDDGWSPEIPLEDKVFYSANPGDLDKYKFDSVEQLVRWRIDQETGGGLMVELGSHQLDAASIFLNHALPVAVVGTGVRSIMKNWDPKVPDHVFLNFEFGEDAKHAVLTYSSISSNALDGYGEQVNGTAATMIIQEERDAYVFREGGDGKNTRINWAEAKLERPAAEAGSTKQWATGVATADTLTSRGYREEQEHMAWLIRNDKLIEWPSKENHYHPDPRFFPRCHGRVALNDAVVTLTSMLAMETKQRIVYKPEWFDPASDATPEADYPIA